MKIPRKEIYNIIRELEACRYCFPYTLPDNETLHLCRFGVPVTKMSDLDYLLRCDYKRCPIMYKLKNYKKDGKD